MDEIRLLAQAIPDEPPPSAETVARARARLIAGKAGARQPRPRRRWGWGWTAGAAVVTAAVVMTVVMLVSNLVGVPEPAPLTPPTTPPAFEEPPRAYQGLNRLSATTVPRSATKERLRFRPTSENIKIVIFCEKPGSIFFTHEGTSSAGGTCGPDGGLSMLADKAHEPGWLGRDHQITIWVFPQMPPSRADAVRAHPRMRARGGMPFPTRRQPTGWPPNSASVPGPGRSRRTTPPPCQRFHPWTKGCFPEASGPGAETGLADVHARQCS
ncbi:hypothetical protein ACFQ0B_56875 [Nonomuraea thailandensis]